MSGFIEGENRQQATMFPERLDDYITEDNSVRVIDVFIDSLELSGFGFKTLAEKTGRLGYHASTMLKLYVYGYLNRVQSSRRLEREAQRNVELMWLLGRLAPDENHLIVDHEVTNIGSDRAQLSKMALKAKDIMGCEKMDVLADKGYFKGPEILACANAGITA
jgi:transposase